MSKAFFFRRQRATSLRFILFHLWPFLQRNLPEALFCHAIVAQTLKPCLPASCPRHQVCLKTERRHDLFDTTLALSRTDSMPPRHPPQMLYVLYFPSHPTSQYSKRAYRDCSLVLGATWDLNASQCCKPFARTFLLASLLSGIGSPRTLLEPGTYLLSCCDQHSWKQAQRFLCQHLLASFS